ncbi:MAG: hypothetical protein HRF49_05325 [bacterium]|jgi:hypothetical protein
MGLFSWLGRLFGKKQSKIPAKIVEYRSRPGKQGSVRFSEPKPSSTYTPSTSYTPRSPREKHQEPPAAERDLFDLAGDRAERRRAAEAKAREEAAAQEQAKTDRWSSAPGASPFETDKRPEPEPEPEPQPDRWSSPSGASPFETAAQPEKAPEPEPATAPPPADDWSPLDLAREIKSAHPEAASAPAEASATSVDTEEPVVELGGEAASPEELSAMGVTVEEPKPEAATAPVEEAYRPAASAEPAAEPEPEHEEEEDSHLLDKIKVQTVEGAGTITIQRKRIETKSMNIGGETFEIAIFEYQNKSKAARVPRAAIEKMTEIAKQNNLKVLPRRQNAAIMAGRFLGVARVELQTRAEKEEYHLVDFTDQYYEISFDPLPEA